MEDKTPEITKAMNDLEQYFKDNNLDPDEKNWTKDPIHGENVTNLLFKLNKERDKLDAVYPARDYKKRLKLIKMAKETKKAKAAKKAAKAKEAMLQEVKTKKSGKKSETKEAAPKKRTVQKYDYPLVNGKEMTADEKKKFRAQQRALAKGEKPKAAKSEKTAKKAAKKSSKETKKVDSKVKKVKKAKKEED